MLRHIYTVIARINPAPCFPFSHFLPVCQSPLCCPLFYLLGEPAFLIVARIPIHSCLWFAIDCSPFTASPNPTHPTDQVQYLHRRHQQHQLSRLIQGLPIRHSRSQWRLLCDTLLPLQEFSKIFTIVHFVFFAVAHRTRYILSLLNFSFFSVDFVRFSFHHFFDIKSVSLLRIPSYSRTHSAGYYFIGSIFITSSASMYSVPFFLAVVGGTTLKCYVAILKGLNKILKANFEALRL